MSWPLVKISDFCQKHDIKDNIEFVIHSVKHKPTILKMIESDIHFDDDINVIKKLYSKQRNGFLMGEFLSPMFLDNWYESLTDSGHIKYFDETTIAQRRSLLT